MVLLSPTKARQNNLRITISMICIQAFKRCYNTVFVFSFDFFVSFIIGQSHWAISSFWKWAGCSVDPMLCRPITDQWHQILRDFVLLICDVIDQYLGQNYSQPEALKSLTVSVSLHFDPMWSFFSQQAEPISN